MNKSERKRKAREKSGGMSKKSIMIKKKEKWKIFEEANAFFENVPYEM